jgi:hypothetical protein
MGLDDYVATDTGFTSDDLSFGVPEISEVRHVLQTTPKLSWCCFLWSNVPHIEPHIYWAPRYPRERMLGMSGMGQNFEKIISL